MLNVIEDFVAAALRAALGAALPLGSVVVAGPAAAPGTASVQVGVQVARLVTTLPLPSGDPLENREAARAVAIATVPPDAAGGRAYTLPHTALAEIAEVQSPPGRIIRPGDAYSVNGRTIQFLTAPAAPVAVLTRGVAMAGWRDVQVCRADLVLTIWAPTLAQTDTLSGPVLAAALATFVARDAINLSAGGPAGFMLRLLSPVLRLSSLSRRAQLVGASTWLVSATHLALHGTLELTLASGAADPDGVIKTIGYALR